ncbi:hypothetical protein Lalb_Chr00c48g0412781 [Lupinus albus]|uniref:Uncharacterized protein n=1 Tax=Lupinus albus TaxID=3870 RepID=A0A6A4N9H9_LUPAL|nr:hypothetical protein Lalb_Chr00c48g0412781 [Lupinus albus]
MYMKSMQQSLANMKLPLDFESGPNSSGSSTSEQKLPASKKGNSSRVFYGAELSFDLLLGQFYQHLNKHALHSHPTDSPFIHLGVRAMIFNDCCLSANIS